jgi:hypothetical protein
VTPRRIALWSGPRNISTAMMRSWGNRPDTFVCDEPLYAFYLTRRSPGHPDEAAVVARHETDWRKVVAWLTGPIPDGKSIFYQKQMAHHLLPEVERGWLDGIDHGFLIREPAAMLVSLSRLMAAPALVDTGLPQQVEIFEQVRARTGRVPPVVDASDVLGDPEGMLRRLCAAFDLDFTPRMLSWPPGPRATDGVWAKHWYHEVEKSTGFRPYAPRREPLPPELHDLHARCDEHYRYLHGRRLRARE